VPFFCLQLFVDEYNLMVVAALTSILLGNVEVRHLLVGICFCLNFVFISLAPQAAETTVRVAYAQSLPLIYTDGHQTVGIYADILSAVCEHHLGWRLSFINSPWKRAQRAVEVGDADIMVTVATPARLEYAHVVEPAIYELSLHVFTSANHEKRKSLASVRTVEDLVRLQVNTATNFGDDWHRSTIEATGVPTRYLPDLTNGFLLVAEGRTDVVIATRSTAKNIIEQNNLQGKIIETGGTLPAPSIHILIGKKSPIAARVGDLEAALASFIAEGRLAAVQARYPAGE